MLDNLSLADRYCTLSERLKEIEAQVKALRARVGATLDVLLAVEQSDDQCYSNGSYARAMQVFMDATRVLTDALREESAE